MLQMNIKKKLNTSFEIRLSNDKQFFCHNTSSKTHIYDFKSIEKIIELDKPKHPGNLRFSKNDEYLLIKSTMGTICVYNTVNFELVKKIQSKKSFKLVEGEVNFTQENSILAVLQTNYGNQIVSIDIHSEEHTILTEFEDSLTLIQYNQFMQTENSHLFTLSYLNNADYKVNKIVKVKEPLNKESIEVMNNSENWYWDSILFNDVHNIYILVNNYEITIVDAQFKKILKKRIIVDQYYPDPAGYFQHIHVSNNGSFLVITYSECIFILRYEDLKIILVEKIPYACFAEFTNDDQYLLVGTWENGYILENNLS
jgi:hypothetical protein